MQKGTEKIIIGLVGEMGSGKDTVGDYLVEKYQAIQYRFHEPLKEALEIFLGPKNVSRADLIWLSNNIRAKYGNKIISESLKRRIDKIESGIIVLNGLRIIEDLKFIRNFPGSAVIYVTLSQKQRWQRIHKREERIDDAASFEKFQEYEKAETEVQIPAIGKKADFRLENKGSKEELGEKIEAIMRQIKNIA